MVSVDTVTVPSLLPTDEAIIVEIGVGLGDVTVTGVGEMHSSIQYSGQVSFISPVHLSGSIPMNTSHLPLSFVQSWIGIGTGSDVGPGVDSGDGFGVGRGVGLFVGFFVGAGVGFLVGLGVG